MQMKLLIRKSSTKRPCSDFTSSRKNNRR